MSNILEDTFETYRDNVRLVLLFSVPFLISFIIPFLAPLPAYITAGAIFIRSASIFMNIGPVALAIIVLSVFFSLLFLSFAFVAISLIVKAKRTQTKHARYVLQGIEKYTSRVFVVFLIYAAVLAVVNIVGYYFEVESALTAIVGFVLFMLIFYAPTAIVIDGKRLAVALRDSVRLVLKEPQYFILWFVLITVVISLLDFVFIHLSGTLISMYLLLIVNSLFVLPYFVIYQAEAYMKRFPILKH